MTQKENLPGGQTKSHDGRSQSLQEKAKHVNKSSTQYTSKYVRDKHEEIVERILVTGDKLDIEPYQDVLDKSGEEKRNLIHQIVLGWKRRQMEAPMETPVKALELVEKLVLVKPKLFTIADETDQVPLLVAAQCNINVLFRVIDLVIDKSVLETIKIRCDKDQETCPLSKVHKSRRDQCSIQAKVDMNVESPCLHDRIDVDKMLQGDAELRETLSSALDRQIARQPSCLESLIVDSKFDPAQKVDIQIKPLDSFKLLLQLCPDSVFERANQNGYSPLQMAIRLYNKQAIDYDHLSSIIRALVDRYPSSIYFQAGYEARENHNKTAYRLLKELEAAKSESNVRSRSRTEELLKRTCIGSSDKDWNAKMKFLYWEEKSVRRIWLSLSGETLLLDEAYISIIRKQSGMRFESVMDFVRLPYWNPQDQKPRDQDVADSHREGVVSDVARVSDPYTAIFQWLWDSKVRKIFTVEVDDSGPDPHTNAAIRQSFNSSNPQANPRDFEIEVWKWKKFDICSDTVFIAAPEAREVHLYSSGNTAVLRGWACSSGLPKLTNLQRLIININTRNANDEKDCKQYEQELRKNLADRCPLLKSEGITVEYNGRQAAQAHSHDQGRDRQDGNKSSSTMPKSEEWIKELLAFKEFIHGVLGDKEKPSVKVALLDDGAKLTGLFGKQFGESFRPDKEDYFVGPSTHGTAMAKCIRDICPMAELYVARLDDSRKVENQKFTIASACQALQWAMNMDADIISMSWTFKKKGNGDDEDENDFFTLIQEAVRAKKFIMFGSVPDKGVLADTRDYAPVGLEGVIKIGSATIFGQQAKENLYAHPDFLLPGEELEIQAGEVVSGSSFSTAYASGLAALVLYCLKAHLELECPGSEGIRTKRLGKAKTFLGMTKIFNNLSGRSEDKKIGPPYFVQPYKMLRDKFGDSAEEKLGVIQRIVTDILPFQDIA